MAKATPEQLKQADEMDARSRRHRAEREASFDRCDTDGFISQWASGICGTRDAYQAEILRNGGMSTFPGLFDANTGKRVPAVLCYVANKFAPWKGDREVWRIEGPDRKAVEWVTNGPRATAARGYVVKSEEAPAEAYIAGKGYGLSGQAWAAIRRTDGGYPGRNK